MSSPRNSNSRLRIPLNSNCRFCRERLSKMLFKSSVRSAPPTKSQQILRESKASSRKPKRNSKRPLGKLLIAQNGLSPPKLSSGNNLRAQSTRKRTRLLLIMPGSFNLYFVRKSNCSSARLWKLETCSRSQYSGVLCRRSTRLFWSCVAEKSRRSSRNFL